MISKNQAKLIRSLQLKKNRDLLSLFVAEGKRCIEELEGSFTPVFRADEGELSDAERKQLSSMTTPQAQIAVFKKREMSLPTIDHIARELTLVLDDIQDPGNLGTIIRTADWFGIRHIVCSPHTADCYGPKVVQATMGALARVDISYTPLPEFIRSVRQQLPSLPVYGTLLEGEDIYAKRLSDAGLIVMGNEGNGISKEVRELLTRPLFIPPYPADAHTIESLNVGIATAVTLSIFRRPKTE